MCFIEEPTFRASLGSQDLCKVFSQDFGSVQVTGESRVAREQTSICVWVLSRFRLMRNRSEGLSGRFWLTQFGRTIRAYGSPSGL